MKGRKKQLMSVTCDFCHMSYVANVDKDEREHDRYHKQCMDSYEQTWEQSSIKEKLQLGLDLK